MKKRTIHNWDELPLIMGTDLVGLMLDIHPNTVTKLCTEGILPGKKIGRFWRFEKSAIRNFIEGGNENGKN